MVLFAISWLAFMDFSTLMLLLWSLRSYDDMPQTAFFWHVPLGVRGTKRRHQSPEWAILNHINLVYSEYEFTQNKLQCKCSSCL